MKSLMFLMLLCLSFAANAQLTNESEAGLASANGNTKSQTYNFKQLNVYTYDQNVFTLRARYLNAFANGTETARYFQGGLRYERQVSTSLGFFLGETLEKDRFAGIESRYITDAGSKYRYIDSEKTKLFSELGYRFMKEDRFDGSQTSNSFVRIYNEWENKWNESFSTKYWLELLPNLSDSNDYQINTELSVSAMLTNVFSIKTGFLLRYDHLPAPGIQYKTDTLFTTALVAKF